MFCFVIDLQDQPVVDTIVLKAVLFLDELTGCSVERVKEMGHGRNIITGISSVFPPASLVNSGSLCLEQTCRNTQSNTTSVHSDVNN